MTIQLLLFAASIALWMQEVIAAQPFTPVITAPSQSCMTKWLKLFDPSLSTDSAAQREQVFLQAFQPIDEENAANSSVQGLVSLLFHGQTGARDFVNCLSARVPERCQSQAPCQNGGRCIFSSTSRFGAATHRAYACECPLGFAGEFCQTVLSGCTRRPCQNGGVCQPLSSGGFKCSCPPHFSGRLCEKEWFTKAMLDKIVSSISSIAKSDQRQDRLLSDSRTADWQRTAAFLRSMESRLEKKMEERFDTVAANVSELVARLRSPETVPGGVTERPTASMCLPAVNGTEAVSKIYTHTVGNTSFPAMCNMTVDGGGWTMLMRSSGTKSTIFSGKSWNSYRNGFGRMAIDDFWLGNEKAHLITSSQVHELRIDIVHKRRGQGINHRNFFKYSTLSIGNEATKYMLSVGPLTRSSSPFQRPGRPTQRGMHILNGMKFSTFDQDNDRSSRNCARTHSACGWWYKACGLFDTLPYSAKARFSIFFQDLVYFDMKIRAVSLE